jgi:hypothetical protein
MERECCARRQGGGRREERRERREGRGEEGGGVGEGVGGDRHRTMRCCDSEIVSSVRLSGLVPVS